MLSLVLAATVVALPTEYVNDRFFVTPITADGTKLTCYTDTGGAAAFVFEDRLAALGLKASTRVTDEGTISSAPWPRFREDATIPPPIAGAALTVAPREEGAIGHDCLLGQSWFAGRVWTFDYPGETLYWRADGSVPDHDKAHEVALEFKREGEARANDIARIVVTIDGARVQLLLDTGATMKKDRGASFITTRTFDKWKRRHPNWRLDEDEFAGRKCRMIEVPSLTVGGYRVGPVWFVERPNKTFDEFMSAMTAARVEGALGGSALRYLRVTVDYPHAIAVFEKP
jgi:hypothetical protein